MPEGRILKKKITYDPKVVNLSFKAKFLFTWLIPFLDSEGRILANADYIKGNVLMYVKEIKKKEIESCLKEMAEQNLITIYGNHVLYLQFNGFFKNQKIRKGYEAESNIPAPEELTSSYSSSYCSNSGISKVKKSKVKERERPHTHLDFVKLTNGEYNKLISEYGKDFVELYIKRLNGYIGSKGDKYKSHYFTILNWLNRDNIKRYEQSITEEQHKKTGVKIDDKGNIIKNN